MKKIERSRQFVEQNLTLFRCPVCHQPMEKVVGNSLVCELGHQIDFNKHGYLYFLQQGGQTEYDAAMLSARRKLLTAGLFRPIVEKINTLMPATAQTILDVGSGEGTPLMQLLNLRQTHDVAIGFDISKPGVTLATQLAADAFFCIADLRRLPFNDQTFDTLVEIFSPSDYGEFQRILKPKGSLYKVIPNARYLGELRDMLYPSGDHQTYDNSKVVALFKQHYENVIEHRVTYQFEIPTNLRQEMVLMTPLHWGKDARQLTSDQLKQLTKITVDVTILETKNG